MRIRQGGPADAGAVLALFDEAVEWLVARGRAAQWGSEPLSRNAKMVARVERWAAGGGLWMAEEDGAVVGALAVVEGPEPYIPAAGEPERYVDLLLSSRRYAGRGIGARLLRHAVALAEQAGVGLLRVDCWAGSPELIAYYASQGFTPDGTYTINGQSGQIFERRLGHQPGTASQ